jgi:hypothetical protein
MAACSNALNANPEGHTPLGDAVTAFTLVEAINLLRRDFGTLTSTSSA